MIRRLSSAGYLLALVLLSLLLVASVLGSLAVGAAPLSIGEAILGLRAFIGGASDDVVRAQIVGEIRLPRALLGALIGGGLAISGATLQAVMRSPLADPFVLGVSSGASVGAALAVITGLAGALGAGAATVLAFAAALGSVVLVYAAASVGGRVPAIRLLLAGIAWSSFATAVTGFLLYLAPEASQVRGMVFWLLGGLAAAEWSSVAWTAALALPGGALLFLTSRWQNLLLLGDEPARSLGLDVARARSILVVITALVTAAAVAFAGAIGFVGLIVPHAIRPFTGPDHTRLLPASAVAGALLLVSVDALARTILAPAEIPVGILTGLLGAPFFLVLLRRTHGEAHAGG
jgi:iron complex transport system permease protein